MEQRIRVHTKRQYLPHAVMHYNDPPVQYAESYSTKVDNSER